MNNETKTIELNEKVKCAMPSRSMPEWFGPALMAAQHRDNLARAKWWQRLFHRLFVARRCPCCRYTRYQEKGGR